MDKDGGKQEFNMKKMEQSKTRGESKNVSGIPAPIRCNWSSLLAVLAVGAVALEGLCEKCGFNLCEADVALPSQTNWNQRQMHNKIFSFRLPRLQHHDKFEEAGQEN